MHFKKTWKTSSFHVRVLVLVLEYKTNAKFRDVDTDEGFWLSGPKRDRSDARYGHGATTIENDARANYGAFLDGAPFPGRGLA